MCIYMYMLLLFFTVGKEIKATLLTSGGLRRLQDQRSDLRLGRRSTAETTVDR